jgi:5'-methylthioadenosine phosphorylase
MTQASKLQLGVLGGSGLYQLSGLDVLKEHDIDTPFGKPSGLITEGKIEGKTVFFLARHGKGHVHLPSEVNYRANIYALKSLGVTHLMAISAVGGMKEETAPGTMVIPDQIFDRTKGMRDSTFFGEGCVGHVMFADPFSKEMRNFIEKAAKSKTDKVVVGGTYVCMEGPQFSTRAESHFYRSTTSATVIGMTAIPEAKLAREAEMAYGMLALATDYDCWKDDAEDVTVEAVIATLKANAALANKILKEVVINLPETSKCPTLQAAQYAVITDPGMIPAKTKEKLELLYGKYFNQ